MICSFILQETSYFDIFFLKMKVHILESTDSVLNRKFRKDCTLTLTKHFPTVVIYNYFNLLFRKFMNIKTLSGLDS